MPRLYGLFSYKKIDICLDFINRKNCQNKTHKWNDFSINHHFFSQRSKTMNQNRQDQNKQRQNQQPQQPRKDQQQPGQQQRPNQGNPNRKDREDQR